MTDRFPHGYAAIIGVDDNNITQPALPDALADDGSKGIGLVDLPDA